MKEKIDKIMEIRHERRMTKLHLKLSKCKNYSMRMEAAEDAKIARLQAERAKEELASRTPKNKSLSRKATFELKE
jgi:hypothetical protein